MHADETGWRVFERVEAKDAERDGHEPLAYLTAYLDACAEAGGRPPDGAVLGRFFVWLPVPGSPGGDDARPGHHHGDGPAP